MFSQEASVIRVFFLLEWVVGNGMDSIRHIHIVMVRATSAYTMDGNIAASPKTAENIHRRIVIVR